MLDFGHRFRTLAVAESWRAARSDEVRSDSVPRSIFLAADSSALWVSCFLSVGEQRSYGGGICWAKEQLIAWQEDACLPNR